MNKINVRNYYCNYVLALFHNNCMYLAHHLLTLAHEYRDRLSKIVQRLNLTFADQVTILRDIGSQSFLDHMRYQRNIIFDIIKDSGLIYLYIILVTKKN